MEYPSRKERNIGDIGDRGKNCGAKALDCAKDRKPSGHEEIDIRMRCVKFFYITG